MAGWSNPTLLLHSSLYPLLRYWLQDLLFRIFYWGQQPLPSFNCKKKVKQHKNSLFYVPDSICDFLAYRNNASINHAPNSPPTCSPTAARFVYKARKFQTCKQWQLCTSCIIINRIHIWQFWRSWIICFLKGTNWNKSCIQEFISVRELFWVQCSHKPDPPHL